MIYKIFSTVYVLSFGLLLIGNEMAPNDDNLLTERKIENINDDWQYLENNALSFSQIKNETNWQSIDLPHTCLLYTSPSPRD